VQGAGRAYKAQLRGALTANLDKKMAGLNFSGKVDQSNVKGQAAVTRFSPLALTFDLDADQFDADRLLGHSPATPPSSGQAPAAPPSSGQAPATPPSAGPAPAGQAPAAKQANAGTDAQDETIDLSALEKVD